MTTSKLASKEDIRKALKPALEKGGVQKAILFGSYARGEADEYSDVDLIIVAETERPFIERFKDFATVREASPVKAMDIIVYTPAEFQKMQERENPFVTNALREGESIYEAGS